MQKASNVDRILGYLTTMLRILEVAGQDVALHNPYKVRLRANLENLLSYKLGLETTNQHSAPIKTLYRKLSLIMFIPAKVMVLALASLCVIASPVVSRQSCNKRPQ